MSKFLGREVIPDDIASQVEFWAKAGYDYIPIPVPMRLYCAEHRTAEPLADWVLHAIAL